MNKNDLIEIGLGKSEVDIYLALLRLGKSTATKLTQDTGIHRTYIYDLIEKLREKGLVSQIKEENKQYFYAADPIRIKEYLLEKVQNVENFLPELTTLRNKSYDETTVEVYKGKEGIKTILNDIIKEKKDYFAIGAFKQLEEILPIQSEQFIKKIDLNKIKEKVILEEGINVIKAKNHDYRYLSKQNVILIGIIIYADKVALFIWNEPYIQILIKSKDIAKSYHSQFNLIWKLAKK